MENDLYKNAAEVDLGYELFQTITDFGNPVEIFREAFQNSVDENATEVYCKIYTEKQLAKEDLIIDIWDNGGGLSKDNIRCFFGLALSTKIKNDKTPIGKYGYKGHGTKPFFKSELTEIYSKPDAKKPGWGIILKDPLIQISKIGVYKYSDPIPDNECIAKLPDDINQGFFLRIRNHLHFNTKHTWYKLNHIYLRDYIKWYTVFGTIRWLFNPEVLRAKLYLCGLNIEEFKGSFNDVKKIDPLPSFIEKDNQLYEEINMGHYFPPDRSTETKMKDYVNKINDNKPYYEYYSRNILKSRFSLPNNVHFYFVVNNEGYETRRKYDVLLSGQKKVDKILQHTDAERYGLWACKSGIPIRKVDEWIKGGKGVGAYTYMHAFVDCDAFELIGTRGSIESTDLELLDLVKSKINDILSEKKIQDDLNERKMIEGMEQTLTSIEEDTKKLSTRFEFGKKRHHIILPDGSKILEPSKIKTGYSESETFGLLMILFAKYPNLFSFNIRDYNTSEGVDFVIEHNGYPKYIELKGTFHKKINHSFRNIYKFICYDIEVNKDEIVQDQEELPTKLLIKTDDKFESTESTFNKKRYTSFVLQPESAVITSMEILVLNKILTQVIGAKIE